jgi:hypothetical protein
MEAREYEVELLVGATGATMTVTMEVSSLVL